MDKYQFTYRETWNAKPVTIPAHARVQANDVEVYIGQDGKVRISTLSGLTLQVTPGGSNCIYVKALEE